MDTPETRYARNGDIHIAYQVVGDGPLDLVSIQGWLGSVENAWEYPQASGVLERLSSFARLIIADRRGIGLSDRVLDLGTFEERADDILCVMNEVGSERPALFGWGMEGGPTAAVLAATHPERVTSLALYATTPKGTASGDYPWAPTPEQHEMVLRAYEQRWGHGVGIKTMAPTMAADPRFREWFARTERLTASPAGAAALYRLQTTIDVREILPAIRVPTIVLNRVGDRIAPVEGARYMAGHIPGAKLVELEGSDHPPLGYDDPVLDELELFFTGTQAPPRVERVLATVLFTDIVNSTGQAAERGDRDWKQLLTRHNEVIRLQFEKHRGHEVSTTGDGFLATFDGPARAIRCAEAIVDAIRALGIEVRAGVHTGECELMAGDLGGIAVHIGARVASIAAPGQVLVSSTVKDLVAGSGIEFEDCGLHALKGVPEEWRIYSVTPRARSG
jgi:class 3 adenylate cyclase